MVGKLQSNKAKKAVDLFDYIHSLDNEKLASKISQYQKELNKSVKIFIQINLADEKQKSGLSLSNLKKVEPLITAFSKSELIPILNSFKLRLSEAFFNNLKYLSLLVSIGGRHISPITLSDKSLRQKS